MCTSTDLQEVGHGACLGDGESTRDEAKSRSLFSRSVLSCARTWAFPEQVYAADADRCRSEGCLHCPGRLHSARCPRNPHALAPAFRDDVLHEAQLHMLQPSLLPSLIRPRSDLTSLRFRLAFNLFSLDLKDGLVGTRDFGASVALRIRSARRQRAICRFLA